MKFFTPWTALLLCAGALSATAQAPATSTAEPVKVGVIAFQAAVTQTNEFQRDFADLQKKYEPKRQGLKTLNDQIEALQKQLQTQGTTLNDAERESRTRAIQEKQTKLKRDQEDDQSEFEQDMQQTFNSVASKVGDTLIDYAQKQGYTLVIDGGNQEAQVVLYATDSTNITKAVIDAYNTKSGVPAPAGQPAAVRPAAQHPAAARPAVKH
jgi:outer membrane protein